jgi:predicted DNA-binding transcriptional regulator AlpA
MYRSEHLDADALLGEMRASQLLGLSSRTLQSWRARNEGPPFVRAGRAIRYRRRDLIAWIEANTVTALRSGDADGRRAS